MGAQADFEDGGGLATGDNTAYSVLVSRYMQAIQHERGGLVLDNAAGGAAHRLPDRRGHHEDVDRSDHPRRQHHRVDRG